LSEGRIAQSDGQNATKTKIGKYVWLEWWPLRAKNARLGSNESTANCFSKSCVHFDLRESDVGKGQTGNR